MDASTEPVDNNATTSTQRNLPPLKLKWSSILTKWDITTSERDILVFSTVLKLLLFPTYRSTDFEVHRNWLAITHSLPISKWYYDTTSEWTLDYPPFFAYFEKLLSIPAAFVDSRIVDLNNLNYGAWSVVAYQRTTVILTELVLGAVLLRFTRTSDNPSIQRVISASLFLHPGFLIVDHIHFQYNGFMFGILLWSLYMAKEGNKLFSGFLFAVLLNFKHIYMYIAPPYFVYLLRTFCLSPSYQIQPVRFLTLANTVIGVFLISLGPFILMGQLPQLLSRLFPFTRGLNHAYWAPNVWALVTATDRVFLKFAARLGLSLTANIPGITSTSRGLVGDTVFAVLPEVKPIHTFVITILLQAVFLVKLWLTPTYKSFVTALTLCGYTSFMFGWHVHEKAILLVLVPLSLLAADGHGYFRTLVIASVAGIYSLFPLLFTPAESFIKVAYSLLWAPFVFLPISKLVYQFPRSKFAVIVDRLELLYLGGFALLHFITTIIPLVSYLRVGSTTSLPAKSLSESTNITCVEGDLSCVSPGTGDASQIKAVSTMEFLPLMLTSVYCAVGLVWAFLRLATLYLRGKF